jgi:hypothetical protein
MKNKKMNECGICEEPANDNLKCPNADIYYCNDCIKQFINTLNEKNNITGKILCPCGCKTQVNWKFPAEIAKEYEKFMDKYYEYKESVKSKESPNDMSFRELVNYVNKTVLTQHCPNCNLVYTDFEGCASLICSGCDEQFCPFCNTYGYPYDIHLHIEKCQFNILNKGTTFIPDRNHKYIHSCIVFKKLLKLFRRLSKKKVGKLIRHFKNELEFYKIYEDDFLSFGKFKTEDEMDQFIIEVMIENLTSKEQSKSQREIKRHVPDRVQDQVQDQVQDRIYDRAPARVINRLIEDSVSDRAQDRPVRIIERHIPDEAIQYMAIYENGRVKRYGIDDLIIMDRRRREARERAHIIAEYEAYEKFMRHVPRINLYPRRNHKEILAGLKDGIKRNLMKIRSAKRAHKYKEKTSSTLRTQRMRKNIKAMLQHF